MAFMIFKNSEINVDFTMHPLKQSFAKLATNSKIMIRGNFGLYGQF